MKRKVLAIVLVFAMVLAFMPVTTWAAEKSYLVQVGGSGVSLPSDGWAENTWTSDIWSYEGDSSNYVSYVIGSNPMSATVTAKAMKTNGQGKIQKTDATVKYNKNTRKYKFVVVPEVADQEVVYDGSNKCITVECFTGNGEKNDVKYSLTDGSGYVTADNLALINVGEYTIYYKIANSEKYFNEITGSAKLTITPKAVNHDFEKAVTGDTFTLDKGKKTLTGTYDGAEHGVKVTTTAQGATVTYSETKDGDYSDAWIKYTEVGTHTVYYKVTKSANEYSEGSFDVVIEGKPLEKSMLTYSDTWVYNPSGTDISSTVVVKDGEKTLVKNTDYTISGYTGTDVGDDYTLVVSAKSGSNYSGSFSDTWKINKAEYTGTKTATVNISKVVPTVQSVALPALPTDAAYAATATVPGGAPYTVTISDNWAIVTPTTGFTSANSDMAFTVSVTGAKNYENYDVTVTVHPTTKTVLTLSADANNVTYDNTANVGYKNLTAKNGSETVSTGVTYTYTYYQKNGSIYTLITDAPKTAGVYRVAIKVADNNATYTSEEKQVDFNIYQKELSLTKVAKSSKVKKDVTAAVIDSLYTVDGLVTGDKAETTIAYYYVDLNDDGSFASSERYTTAALAAKAINDNDLNDTKGKITVGFKLSATITGEDKDNYVCDDSIVKSILTIGDGLYDITVATPKYGKVTADMDSADPDETVTLTVEPDLGYMLSELKIVPEDTTKKVTYKSIGKNKYTFVMPECDVTVKATFEVECNFVDVPANSYYYTPVLWAVGKGITTGTDTTHFTPYGVATRAEVLTFLWRAAGCPVVSGTIGFDDVAPLSYYAQAVQWAVAKGIVKGTSATKFSPNAVCTRAQVVTMMARYAGEANGAVTTTFSDVSAKAYYAAAVSWAVKKGITQGVGNNKFNPDGQCYRADVLTFIYRLFA